MPVMTWKQVDGYFGGIFRDSTRYQVPAGQDFVVGFHRTDVLPRGFSCSSYYRPINRFQGNSQVLFPVARVRKGIRARFVYQLKIEG